MEKFFEQCQYTEGQDGLVTQFWVVLEIDTNQLVNNSFGLQMFLYFYFNFFLP